MWKTSKNILCMRHTPKKKIHPKAKQTKLKETPGNLHQNKRNKHPRKMETEDISVCVYVFVTFPLAHL